MEEELANLWSGLTLTDSETQTIVFETEKLIIPSNALIGKLAVRKFTSLYDLEKGLRMIWDVKTPMEITQIGENLYIIELVDRRICVRIFNKQPWTYRGLLFCSINSKEMRGLRTSTFIQHPFGSKLMGYS